jgi:DNA processing protein
MKIKKLTLTNGDIPSSLIEIPSPPRQLFIIGDLNELLRAPAVAIVGSRKVTPYGRIITEKIAGELAEMGIIIISGLALGVDSIAHQAALKAGGKTLAVMPGGLDQIYPRSHYRLAKQILETGGALISEYPEGTPPLKEHFIARNRLVSGLSDGLLIIEAAEKSGTLHTAGFALDQGKTVMAVPGNVTSQLSYGTNSLIKSGAIMVTETADVLSALGLTFKTVRKYRPTGSTSAENNLLEMLSSGISDAALLLEASGLEAREFNQTLTMLEINGKIKPLGAGHWSLS